MDYHLERALQLQTEPEHKNLYTWAINELDAQGQRIGRDQIPWGWSSYFTATSCELNDSIDIKSRSQLQQTTSAPHEVAQREVIRVRLSPGNPRVDEGEPAYSMFGTDRVTKSFQLHIHSIAYPAEHEGCKAWGSVSYTSEIDFRDETTDDCLVFYLFVRPETFAQYAAKISHGSVDEIIFRVGSVAGFYSDWRPSISTPNVKVLTGGREQEITLPPGIQFEPPRLGHVGEAELHINRRLAFSKRAPGPEAVEIDDFGVEQEVPKMQLPAAMDQRMLQMLGSLRTAAWFVVCLLALIFIATMLKR